MIVLTIRTDKPESEIGIFKSGKQIAYEEWAAHRQLAETIHKKIEELLESQSLELRDLNGVICFSGPGSFTGLRIGASVANAIAYSLEIPVIGVNGDGWLADGLRLVEEPSSKYVVPDYGAPVFITRQKK